MSDTNSLEPVDNGQCQLNKNDVSDLHAVAISLDLICHCLHVLTPILCKITVNVT